jgi:hypothetical protein
VSLGMRRATVLNGSAHVSANVLISSTPASFVSGKGIGSARLKKPSRIGHETTIWQVYLSSLPSGALPGASRTAMSVAFTGAKQQRAYR